MQRLLGYLAASVHSRLNRLQNHSTYFSQCRATAKHIALICRRKKILPTSLNYCDYLIYLLQPKKLDVCAPWTIETDRFTSLDGFQSGFGWRGSCHTWHHVRHKGNKLNFHNSSGWHHVRHKGNKLNFHNSSGRSLLYKKLLLRKI